MSYRLVLFSSMECNAPDIDVWRWSVSCKEDDNARQKLWDCSRGPETSKNY